MGDFFVQSRCCNKWDYILSVKHLRDRSIQVALEVFRPLCGRILSFVDTIAGDETHGQLTLEIPHLADPIHELFSSIG